MRAKAVPVVELSVAEARRLTDAVRSQLEQLRRGEDRLWALLLAAYEGRAWSALGYSSWREYATVEYRLSRSHAYRLLDQARVITALEEAAGLSPVGEIPERETRRLKPVVAEVASAIRSRVSPGMSAEEVRDLVRDVTADIAALPTAPVPSTTEASSARIAGRAPIAKPDLGGGLSHPARFSDELLPHFRELLTGHRRVLDPFAGTGRIHELRPEFDTVGVEIEPEWARLSRHTRVGNALRLRFRDSSFDAICTSPTYGNRLADHHAAADPHLRRSYRHDLGRPLHPDNSGRLQWGERYRDFHAAAWSEAVRVLRVGGVFVLNVKDHLRGGDWQDVAGWHAQVLGKDLGLDPIAIRPVVTTSLRQGANAGARAGAELLLAFRKS